MLSEYRQRFTDYHTELYQEDYLLRSGRKRDRETEHIRREYSDLFEPSAISELRAKLQDTPQSRATERTGIQRLIAFAVDGALHSQTNEISAEIEKFESSSRIDWHGRSVPLLETASLLSNERNADLRRDLFARRADLIASAQDLRAERFEKSMAAAKALGYENLLALRIESNGINYQGLAERTKKILSQTESGYVNALSSLSLRETGVALDDATAADLGFLQSFKRFDHFFPVERMFGIYRELFAAFGFNVDKQTNLSIDSEPHPGKQPQAFCSPIRVPDDIKLVVNLTGGQSNYREFLRETGHAQLYAWTSRNIYPEFRVGGDSAILAAWGSLLENLVHDESWLMSTFGFVENSEFRHALAVFRLMSQRRAAAMLDYEIELFTGGLTAGAGKRYAELMTDAARVIIDETEHLNSPAGAFYSADYLRASAFESQMREYLKTRFGQRWWASRKAGETLIDMWNTGQRYKVEELAAMIGLGELDFDWMISESLDWLKGRTR